MNQTKDYKLILGDCLEKLKDIPSESVDCVVTSPPYWKGFAYESYFNSYLQYTEWSENWLKEIYRILKPNGTFFLNISNDSETTIRAFEVLNIATRKVMFKLHDTIIWYCYNRQPANTDRQLTNQHEYIFMFVKQSAGVKLFKDQVTSKEIFDTKNIGNVWKFGFNVCKDGFFQKETKSAFGHSGFPLVLPKTCIELTTNEQDTVLDCFLGSGQTGIAAIQLNRKFIGIEKELNYFEIAQKRIEEAINKQPLFAVA